MHPKMVYFDGNIKLTNKIYFVIVGATILDVLIDSSSLGMKTVANVFRAKTSTIITAKKNCMNVKCDALMIMQRMNT